MRAKLFIPALEEATLSSQGASPEGLGAPGGRDCLTQAVLFHRGTCVGFSGGCSHLKAQRWLQGLLPRWFSHTEPPSSSPLGPLHRADWVVSTWRPVRDPRGQSGSCHAFCYPALKSHVLLLPACFVSHTGLIVREAVAKMTQVLGSVGHLGAILEADYCCYIVVITVAVCWVLMWAVAVYFSPRLRLVLAICDCAFPYAF